MSRLSQERTLLSRSGFRFFCLRDRDACGNTSFSGQARGPLLPFHQFCGPVRRPDGLVAPALQMEWRFDEMSAPPLPSVHALRFLARARGALFLRIVNQVKPPWQFAVLAAGAVDAMEPVCERSELGIPGHSRERMEARTHLHRQGGMLPRAADVESGKLELALQEPDPEPALRFRRGGGNPQVRTRGSPAIRDAGDRYWADVSELVETGEEHHLSVSRNATPRAGTRVSK